jgi:hypothetical protein
MESFQEEGGWAIHRLIQLHFNKNDWLEKWSLSIDGAAWDEAGGND